MEKSSINGYIKLLMVYAISVFRDFGSYLGRVAGLAEDDIQLILKHNISNSVSHELHPAIYSIKDISEAVHTMRDHEGTLQNENDDISMKTKLNLTRFVGCFETLRFEEKSFLTPF